MDDMIQVAREFVEKHKPNSGTNRKVGYLVRPGWVILKYAGPVGEVVGWGATEAEAEKLTREMYETDDKKEEEKCA